MDLSDKVYEELPGDSVLRSLSRQELSDFISFAVVKRLTRNETLIKAGDPGNSMMIVLSGTLKICISSSSGREVVLDYLGPGGIIGDIGFRTWRTEFGDRRPGENTKPFSEDNFVVAHFRFHFCFRHSRLSVQLNTPSSLSDD